MTTPTTSAQTVAANEPKAVGRLRLGAGLGLAAAAIAVGVPAVLLYLAAYGLTGFLAFGPSFVEALSILFLAGAILFLLSFFAYRRSFAAFRRVDARFAPASVLCLIGTIGTLVLVVSAALLLGSSSSLVACLHGRPAHVLSCIRTASSLEGYASVAGFWLGWIGGVGVVLGLGTAGGRYRRGALTGAAVLYALVLLALVGPFLVLFRTFPDANYVLLATPLLLLLAPALVWSGTHPWQVHTLPAPTQTPGAP
jgi:hypothetical protein